MKKEIYKYVIRLDDTQFATLCNILNETIISNIKISSDIGEVFSGVLEEINMNLEKMCEMMEMGGININTGINNIPIKNLRDFYKDLPKSKK